MYKQLRWLQLAETDEDEFSEDARETQANILSFFIIIITSLHARTVHTIYFVIEKFRRLNITCWLLLLCVYVQRSTAMVKWSTVGQANLYRVGHKGKVMQYTLSGVHICTTPPPSPLYTVACLCFVVPTYLCQVLFFAHTCRWIFAVLPLEVVDIMIQSI